MMRLPLGSFPPLFCLKEVLMDHERVNISSYTMSCGVMELSRIGEETEGVLYALASRLYHPCRGAPCACFLFSDVVETTTGSSPLTASSRLSEIGRAHV